MAVCGLVLSAAWVCETVADDAAQAARDSARTEPAVVDRGAAAGEPTPAVERTTYSVEELTRRVRPSLVTISVTGRDGGQFGLGTGFVISPSGLIATNLHVIGEGHRFSVELSDGRELKVRSIHASEPQMDLVVIQVDPADRELKPLPLGDSAAVAQGAPVVAMGNPQGLKHSVVAGLISARREINGHSMLQLAMPIEPGNSGGPVVDMQGRVLGLVNMKSTVNDNLGFAVEVNSLKPLLARPNPIPIERWTTIGSLDARRWQPLFGASWRQRSGRILVSGAGEGFGGRSLCLQQAPAPEPPFEVAVQVKLSDEAGAAGLVFHSDGADRHYGFYPSNGQLRLTCFDGPSVFQWQVLREQPSPHYRPGEWNRLKVRIEKDKLSCYVNDHLVMQSDDKTFVNGKVGLAKFRNTSAEFKQFRVAKEVTGRGQPGGELAESVRELPALAAVAPERVAELADSGELAVETIRQEARELERRSEALSRLARDVHVARVCRELGQLVQNRDEGFDLLRGALWIARLDEEDIDVEGYVQEVDRMAAEVAAASESRPAAPHGPPGDRERKEAAKDALPAGPASSTDPSAALAPLNEYLFHQNGFHGARFDYYQRANSYLNRVIDDRAGLPITMSILYLELGRRLGLAMEGVGMPSHFVVRYRPPAGEPVLIDVFDRAKVLSRDDARRLVRENADVELTDEHLQPLTPRAILRRVLNNLRGIADRDAEALLVYTEAAVAITPDSADEHLKRALLRAQTGRTAAGLADVDWILERQPPGVNLDAVRAFRERVQREAATAP